MTLELDDMEDGVSSWVGLLRAYERFALLDEGQIVDDVCERLMRAQPQGLTKSPAAPSALFRRLVHEVAPAQLALVEELADERGEEGETWLAPARHFWTETFEGALDLPFPGVRRPTRRSLRELLRAAERKQRDQEENRGRRSAEGAAGGGERYGEAKADRRVDRNGDWNANHDRRDDWSADRHGDGRGDRSTDRPTDRFDEFDADRSDRNAEEPARRTTERSAERSPDRRLRRSTESPSDQFDDWASDVDEGSDDDDKPRDDGVGGAGGEGW
jgi:hypothetical protein